MLCGQRKALSMTPSAWKPMLTCSKTKLRLLYCMRQCLLCRGRKALPCETLTTSLNFTLWSMWAKVAEDARALLAEHLAGERCRIVGGDFCAEVPSGGDAYLLKRVVVVLDDDRCGQVLRNCRKAVSPGGRLLVAEPDPSSL